MTDHPGGAPKKHLILGNWITWIVHLADGRKIPLTPAQTAKMVMTTPDAVILIESPHFGGFSTIYEHYPSDAENWTKFPYKWLYCLTHTEPGEQTVFCVKPENDFTTEAATIREMGGNPVVIKYLVSKQRELDGLAGTEIRFARSEGLVRDKLICCKPDHPIITGNYDGRTWEVTSPLILGQFYDEGVYNANEGKDPPGVHRINLPRDHHSDATSTAPFSPLS